MRFAFLFILMGCFSFGSEYIFTYRIATKNGFVISEEYNFSKAMMNSRDFGFFRNAKKSCEIVHQARSERAFLKTYKQEILECFFNWGVKLEDRTKNINNKSISNTYLAIPPTRVEVEYEKGIATIWQLVK